MSTQETLIANTAKIVTVKASQFFGKSFNEIYKVYNVPKEETYTISSLFFKKFYKLRKENDLLNSDTININYELFKSIIHKHCQMMSDYLDIKVQQQKVLSIFLKNLNHLSLKKDDLIEINELTFFYGKNTSKMLSQLSALIAKTNVVNQCAIKTFKRFVNGTNNEEIPLELSLILLCDAQTIYYVYDRLLGKGTKAYKTYMLESALLMQLAEIPLGTIHYNDTQIFYRNNPPEVDDLDFTNAVNNKGNAFSLPPIIHNQHLLLN